MRRDRIPCSGSAFKFLTHIVGNVPSPERYFSGVCFPFLMGQLLGDARGVNGVKTCRGFHNNPYRHGSALMLTRCATIFRHMPCCIVRIIRGLTQTCE